MSRSEQRVETVSITQLVRNKRLLELAPNAIRILAGLVVATIAATIIFGMPLRLIAGLGFLLFYVRDVSFAVMIVPVFLTTLLIYIIASAMPFWLLARVSKDSTKAIVTSILLCCVGVYLIWAFAPDGGINSIGWITIGALAAAVLTLLAHLGYLAHVRRSPLAGAVTLPRRHGGRRTAGLVPQGIGLFLRAAGAFTFEMLKILAIGSLVWLPIALIGIAVPPLAALILLGIFVAKRKAISGRILGAFRTFKARIQRNAGEILELDNRKPVLFLRSFVDDNISTRNVSGRVASVILGADVDSMRLEECVVDAVFRLGPVVALNQPGSLLPVLGAAKENVSGDWKDRVQNYLEKSQLIILIYGTSEGLQWELDEIFRRGYSDKLIVVSPPRPDIASHDVVRALHMERDDLVLLPGERILAVAGDRTTGTARAVVGRFEDAMSYTLAMRYCLAMTQRAGAG